MAEQCLSAAEELQLGLSRAFYGVARVLRLTKLRDLLSAARLGPDATVYLLGHRYCCPPHATEAHQEEALARMLLHFHSIPWMTYRTGFTPIAVGDVQLRSDAGWGCTLRSGQMILAVGLQRHLLGSGWRWPQPPEQHGTAGTAGAAAAAAAVEAPPELARLLQLFWDTPAERNPFSLHNLCLHGRGAGVVPGRWLGPWAMCRALEAAAAAAQAHHDLGVTVAVLADAGGAPLLVASRFESAFAASGGGGGGGGEAGQQEQQWDGQQQQQNGPTAAATAAGGSAAEAAGGEAAEAAAAAVDAQPELVPVDSCTLAVEAPSPAAALAASTGHLSLNGGGTAGSRGLILLVPLTLGIGKLTPCYAPQLEAVLTWPQSIGIVGGRPASSLYFVGCQVDAAAGTAGGTAAGTAAGAAAGAAGTAAGIVGTAAGAAAGAAAGVAVGAAAAGQQVAAAGGIQAPGGGSSSSRAGEGASGSAAGSSSSGSGSVIYLDPHQVQEAACCDADWLSFRCEAPKSMAAASIDPSLALGFYCGSLGDYRDLCSRLAALEQQSGGAPLVCVTTAEAAAAAAAYNSLRASEWEPDEMSSGELSEGRPVSEGEEEQAAEDEAAAAAEDEAAAAEAVAAARSEAAARQRQLEEEPEILTAPPAAAASSAAAGGSAGSSTSVAAAGSPRSPPAMHGPQQTAAAASPRQASLTPRHSRGWELL